MELSWLLALLPVLTFGAGAFFGAYLKQKGENLATHEDINKLVDQVRAVTTATKQIEAKISDAVWDRQKRWELRRDAIFEAVKNMGHVEDALQAIRLVLLADGGSDVPEQRQKVFERFNAAANNLDRSSLIVALVCDEELKDDLLDLSTSTRVMVKQMGDGDLDSFEAWGEEFVDKFTSILKKMRDWIERVA